MSIAGFARRVQASRVARNTMLQLTSQGLSIIVGMITFAMISRALGTVGYGAYALATTVAAFVGITLDAGLDTHVVSRLAAVRAADPASPVARQTVSDALTVRVVLGIVATAVAVAMSALGGYPPEIIAGVAVLSATALGGAMTATLGNVFQAAQDVVPAVLGGMGSRLFSGLVVAALFAAHALNLWSLLAAMAAGAVVSLMITGGIVARRGFRLRRPSPGSAWSLYRATAPLAVWVILGQVIYRADVIILSAVQLEPSLRMSGQEAVGIYVAAYKLYDLSNALPGFIVVSLMPVLSALGATEPDLMGPYLRRWFLRMTGIGLVLGATIAVVGGPFLLQLSGPAFAGSAPLIPVLSGAVPLAFVTSLLYAAIVASNRRRAMVVLFAVVAIANVGGNILLAPAFAYWASAWLTTGSQAVLALGMCWLMRRELWPRGR